MKSRWASKTLWVNGLAILAGGLAYLVGQEFIQNQESLLAMLIAFQGGVNVILRFWTTKPIK
jgi:hypothetical protein